MSFRPPMAVTDTDRFIIWSGIAIFNILGNFGNVNVIVAHFRLPTLQTKYGILLSLLCFCQSICLLFEFVNIVYGLEGHVIRSTCFYIISPYMVVLCGQTGLMATISVDLFISIAFPLRHRISSTGPYLTVLCIPTLCYAAVVIAIAVLHMDNAVIELCNPPLSLPPPANQIWYFVAFCFGGVTVVTYIFSFSTIVARRWTRPPSRANVKAAMNVEQKAMKSLSVLLVVFVVTSFLPTVIANLMTLLGTDTDLIVRVQSYNVISAMICYSSTFYVCVLRSGEYRKIFWAQISEMFRSKHCFPIVISLIFTSFVVVVFLSRSRILAVLSGAVN